MGKSFEARNGSLTAWVERLSDPEDPAPSYRLWCLGPDGEPVYCSRWEWGYASRTHLCTLAVDWCAHGVTPVDGEAKMRTEDPRIREVTAWIRDARDQAGLTNADLERPFGFAGMAGHWTTTASQPTIPTPEQWEVLWRMFNRAGVDVPGTVHDAIEDLNAAKGTWGNKPQRGSVRSDAWDSPARWRRERRKVWIRDFPNMDRFEQWEQ